MDSMDLIEPLEVMKDGLFLESLRQKYEGYGPLILKENFVVSVFMEHYPTFLKDGSKFDLDIIECGKRFKLWDYNSLYKKLKAFSFEENKYFVVRKESILSNYAFFKACCLFLDHGQFLFDMFENIEEMFQKRKNEMTVEKQKWEDMFEGIDERMVISGDMFYIDTLNTMLEKFLSFSEAEQKKTLKRLDLIRRHSYLDYSYLIYVDLRKKEKLKSALKQSLQNGIVEDNDDDIYYKENVVTPLYTGVYDTFCFVGHMDKNGHYILNEEILKLSHCVTLERWVEILRMRQGEFVIHVFKCTGTRVNDDAVNQVLYEFMQMIYRINSKEKGLGLTFQWGEEIGLKGVKHEKAHFDQHLKLYKWFRDNLIPLQTYICTLK